MSKHQDILNYLEKLPLGQRVSVRSISNHLQVSDGTAYRAIKEAENRGLVETRPRSGTVRVSEKSGSDIERLTYAEIARISDSTVLAGEAGLGHTFSKFSIGAMTEKNVLRYLVKGGLLIVGDREEIQLIALNNNNAILVTGGFSVSESVIQTANNQGIPVMVTNYDTFTVATMINHVLSDVRIKTDMTTVAEVYQDKDTYGYLRERDMVSDFHQLIKETKNVRFPVVNNNQNVIGVVSMLDVMNREVDTPIKAIMSTNIVIAKPEASLANISQKMIFEDLNMLPVIREDLTLLGVVTRRQIVENLPNFQHANPYTYSEQMLANLTAEADTYQFVVEPAMIDSAGHFSEGVLAEFIKETTVRRLTQNHQRNIIIEQMMLYFLQAVQIDDCLTIRPIILSETRRHSTVDVAVYLEEQVIAKAMVMVKIN